MTYECDKCEHYRVIDDHGDKTMECLITKCPLVLRDEVLEGVYHEVMTVWSTAHEEGLDKETCHCIALVIRAMKGQRK